MQSTRKRTLQWRKLRNEVKETGRLVAYYALLNAAMWGVPYYMSKHPSEEHNSKNINCIANADFRVVADAYKAGEMAHSLKTERKGMIYAEGRLPTQLEREKDNCPSSNVVRYAYKLGYLNEESTSKSAMSEGKHLQYWSSERFPQLPGQRTEMNTIIRSDPRVSRMIKNRFITTNPYLERERILAERQRLMLRR